MTKIAYFDCPTGVSGDMCLGALVSAGVPLEHLQTQLARLSLGEEYQLVASPRQHNGQAALKVDVVLNPDSHPPHRHLADIQTLIQQAQFPPRVEAWSLAVFEKLAIAEAAVHGSTVDQVHFHEVGATDAIVDIVGTCLGLDWLGVEQIYCSALPTGGGTVRAAHGRLSVPVPAVLKLWESHQVPVYHNGIDRELVTPTGAALMVTLAEQFGTPPEIQLQTIGLGAGNISLPLPNILRLWLGEARSHLRPHRPPVTTHSHEDDHHPTPDHHTHEEHETTHEVETDEMSPRSHHNAHNDSHDDVMSSAHPTSTSESESPELSESPWQTEQVMVLETQIDDCSPQGLAYTVERLFEIGALDVFTQPVTMKKSRLGSLMTVICSSDRAPLCEQILFQETPTLGIRRQLQERHILERTIETVNTTYGTVRVKVARQQGKVINMQPEYEDCAAIARSSQQPWQTIHYAARVAWHKLEQDED